MGNIISVAPAAGVAQASTGRGGRPVEWPPASRRHRLGLACPGLALEPAYSLCLSALELHVCGGSSMAAPLPGVQGGEREGFIWQPPPENCHQAGLCEVCEGCVAGEVAARRSQLGQAFTLAVGVSRPRFDCEK